MEKRKVSFVGSTLLSLLTLIVLDANSETCLKVARSCFGVEMVSDCFGTPSI